MALYKQKIHYSQHLYLDIYQAKRERKGSGGWVMLKFYNKTFLKWIHMSYRFLALRNWYRDSTFWNLTLWNLGYMVIVLPIYYNTSTPVSLERSRTCANVLSKFISSMKCKDSRIQGLEITELFFLLFQGSICTDDPLKKLCELSSSVRLI